MLESQFDLTKISTRSEKAALEYLEALKAYVALNGDIITHVKAAVALDAQFMLANALLGALYSFANMDAEAEPLKSVVEALQNAPIGTTARELLIADAVTHLARGRVHAAGQILERVVLEFPHDMLALKLTCDCYFYTGDSDRILHLIDEVRWAKLLKEHPTLMTCYGYALGMRSFALIESGQVAVGGDLADRALAINSNDVWSIHARAHYFESTKPSNYIKALEWTESVRATWAQSSSALQTHMWWHVALFNMGLNYLDEAWKIFIDHLKKQKGTSHVMDLADATSLLWRLELRGRTIEQAFWDEMADEWTHVVLVRKTLSPNTYPFNLIHMALSLSKSSIPVQRDTLQRLLNALDRVESEASLHTSRDAPILHATARATKQICAAIDFFARGRFYKCVDAMYPVRSQVQKMGGSVPQRSIFLTILAEASRRLAEELSAAIKF